MDDLDILAAAFASDDDDTPMEDAMLEDGEQSQGTDALEDAHRIQLSMLEEAFADEVVANEFDVAFASDAEDGAEEHAPVSAEQSDAVEPVGRKRGRPRGSKNKPKTQEPEKNSLEQKGRNVRLKQDGKKTRVQWNRSCLHHNRMWVLWRLLVRHWFPTKRRSIR